MAEGKASSKISGWVKAGITSIMGLCSGAVLMYVSPLVTNVIKPAKPLANFSEQIQGLTVTFQNRATGATDGWWDFGDGSPLEPFSATQQAISHTYDRASNYTVKLSLRNFLGEETDRTVSVNLDGTAGAAGTAPVIEAFKVEPIKRDAPATFHVVSQTKNADQCIWVLGDDRPVEVSSDTSQDRYVTIPKPGTYTMRLIAVNAKHTVEKSETIVVKGGNNAAPMATLQVSYKVVPIKHLTKDVNLHTVFPADRKEQTFPFSLTYGEPDYQIAHADFASAARSAIRGQKSDQA